MELFFQAKQREDTQSRKTKGKEGVSSKWEKPVHVLYKKNKKKTTA